MYMVSGPAHWVTSLMQITSTTLDFKVFLVGLGLAYLAVGWTYDRYLAQHLAKSLGLLKQQLTGVHKKRKEYKLIDEGMRV